MADYDEAKVKKAVDKYLYDYNYTGDFVGGSGHLGSVRATKLEIKEVKDTEYNGKPVFEITFYLEAYTETEFMHNPEDDHMYTDKYTIKFFVDKDYNIIETEKEKKRKNLPHRRRFGGIKPKKPEPTKTSQNKEKKQGEKDALSQKEIDDLLKKIR